MLFLGTPAWAVPSLEGLLETGVEVAAVVTNPDRPAGRGMELKPPPVKETAVAAGLDVIQPAGARSPEFLDQINALAPDVAVVVAYGSILPTSVLDAVPHGFVNVHFSLLPEYRGAAPVQRAVMDGKKETGVSIMVLTEGMDEGPVVATAATTIDPSETSGELGERLAGIGATLLTQSLPGYVDGSIEPVPQDDSLATYAPKITTDEARIDWKRPASQIHDLVRGLNPAPGAWSTFRDTRIKVHATSASAATGLEPGEIGGDADLLVGTGDGTIRLEDVQPAGKKRMDGSEMKRGMRPEPGERLQ